jgi:histidinol-phosphate aminotransferase
MDWITDSIALGDYEDSINPEGVDAVLNVAAEAAIVHELPYLHLNMRHSRPISRRDLNRALEFLAKQLSNGHRVLVHCDSGVSRSPAIVAAFLAATGGISVEAALRRIQDKHWEADPDPVVWESIKSARTCGRVVKPVLQTNHGHGPLETKET